MAQEGGPNEVGQMVFTVGADLTGLRSALKQGEHEIQQSAQRMAQSAVVPIGNKSGAAGIGGAGGAPVGDKSGIKQLKQESDSAKKSVVELGVETQKSFRNALQVITRTTGAIALMAAAAAGVVRIIKRISDEFIGGEVAANKFLSSIGPGVGDDAEKTLKSVEDRIQKINEHLAERPAMSIFERLSTSKAAMENERNILIQSLQPLRGQIEAQKQRRLDEQRRKDDLERNAQIEKKQIESVAEGYEELKRLKKELASPTSKLDMELDEQMKLAERARDFANGMFSPMADALERAAKEAWKRSQNELKKVAQDAITEAFNDAMSNQVNGFDLGRMTTLLSQLNIKVQAIHNGLPRRWK